MIAEWGKLKFKPRTVAGVSAGMCPCQSCHALLIFGNCPFPSGRIVSLLSKFRLGFHEVHILPDINQKPRAEQ